MGGGGLVYWQEAVIEWIYKILAMHCLFKIAGQLYVKLDLDSIIIQKHCNNVSSI